MALTATLGPLRRGRGDPTFTVTPDGALWRTTTTPAGPAVLRLVSGPATPTVEGWPLSLPAVVHAQAWGPGARWAVAAVPDSLGARDDTTGFDPPAGRVTDTWRRHPGLRIPCTGRVWDVLLAAILEQKVTGKEAHRSWRELVATAGGPAPMPDPDDVGFGVPTGMGVPPTPAAVLGLPDWEWHRCGVDGARRRAIRAAATVAPRLEECTTMTVDAAIARLRLVPGVGLWTAAEVAQRALCDADSVSVGDYHLASFVGWALAGAPVDDDGMLELLAAYRPHRHRIVRLLEVSGFRKPRFGPRMSVRDYRTV